MSAHGRVTAQDVAREAGCHAKTVGVALRQIATGEPDRFNPCSAELMERVRAAAERLDYSLTPSGWRSGPIEEALGLSHKTINTWAAAGWVPHTMALGYRWYSEADVRLVAILAHLIDARMADGTGGGMSPEAAAGIVAELRDFPVLPPVLVATVTGHVRGARDMVHAVTTVAPRVRKISGQPMPWIIDVGVVTGPALEKLEAGDGDN